MLLYVVCKKSKEYKKAIDACCAHVGLINYQIVDPLCEEMNRVFSHVLVLDENYMNMKFTSQKQWGFEPPAHTMDEERKRIFILLLKEIAEYSRDFRVPDRIKPGDIPDLVNLKDFLNNMIGQVVELRLPDRRKLGIYPDIEKLKGTYDIEYHASVIVNLAKLFHLFDATEIVIKEI